MGELTGQSLEGGVVLKEDLRKEGLLVLDIGESFSCVAWLSGEIAVDARDKVTPVNPKGWTDRKELERYTTLMEAVRIACCSSNGDRETMNSILLRAGKRMGLGATSATVVGEVPAHWMERNHITRRYFKTLERLNELYPPLDTP